ncbi:Mitogen-activated protein kinase kinase kinase 11 [Monoraphidium neglectum]|uniref:Mitogen-activated protein kinase kinase kinase 11 n=1 Tax=Monoraphidium neglectum TaxID=145388 RepID=A0A0D2J7X0_9CHLO|nr:Mitogen-activated protein kinase kinase kinase 11 [Monoraphidium neglectum]KIY95882.1 Mitogen-activated protein kinase kinase kinase 11 [Monoraphidium neglectum]|eukprot:XP_013894902.1 Mitogen-activated protein kinase kinase kinase 11 [Monoraphidium neglectum]
MAVLSTVQHPNIVQLYACLTDVVEVQDDGGGTSIATSWAGSIGSISGLLPPGCPRSRYRKLQPDEEPGEEVTPCNILVMEYCDQGTLRDVVKGGAFRAPPVDGRAAMDLAPVLEILLDVAYAMQYLHSLQLVHGDIKLENVLMKTDSSRRIKMTPKLGDFGLAKILNEARHTLNLSGAGTITHLAPEMFEAGSKVTTAVDSYAFGILMWELWTGGRKAYQGLPQGIIADHVTRKGLRPAFPPSAPPLYARLAAECWGVDPHRRPTFVQIAERLEALLAPHAPPDCDGGGGDPGGGGGAGSGTLPSVPAPAPADAAAPALGLVVGPAPAAASAPAAAPADEPSVAAAAGAPPAGPKRTWPPVPAPVPTRALPPPPVGRHNRAWPPPPSVAGSGSGGRPSLHALSRSKSDADRPLARGRDQNSSGDGTSGVTRASSVGGGAASSCCDGGGASGSGSGSRAGSSGCSGGGASGGEARP